MSFVDLGALKARVSSDSDDPSLQDLLDEEERFLERYVGPLAGERTETFVLPWVPTVTGLYLARTTDAVALTGAGVAIPDADFLLYPDGMFVERVDRAMTWRTPIVATYTPNDSETIRAAIIDLVAARVAQITSGGGVIEYEQIGSYARRFGTSARTAPSVVRSDILRRLLPPVELTATRLRYA